MKCFTGLSFISMLTLMLLVSCAGSSNRKELADSTNIAESSPKPEPNDKYLEAKEIVTNPAFQQLIQKLTEADKMSDAEKFALNDNIKPSLRKALSLFRNAYKEMPPNAEVNFELVYWFHVDYLRIIKIGKRSEKMEALNAGFQTSTGNWITGYPEMIKFHALECKKYDSEERYQPAVDEILRIMGM